MNESRLELTHTHTHAGLLMEIFDCVHKQTFPFVFSKSTQKLLAHAFVSISSSSLILSQENLYNDFWLSLSFQFPSCFVIQIFQVVIKRQWHTAISKFSSIYSILLINFESSIKILNLRRNNTPAKME